MLDGDCGGLLCSDRRTNQRLLKWPRHARRVTRREVPSGRRNNLVAADAIARQFDPMTEATACRLDQAGASAFSVAWQPMTERFMQPDRACPTVHCAHEPCGLDQARRHARLHVGSAAREQIAYKYLAIDGLARQRANLDRLAGKPRRLAPRIGIRFVGIRSRLATRRLCWSGLHPAMCYVFADVLDRKR